MNYSVRERHINGFFFKANMEVFNKFMRKKALVGKVECPQDNIEIDCRIAEGRKTHQWFECL